MFSHLLIDSDDVGQEGERLDLRAHEIDEDLLVEVLVGELSLRRLERDRVHDQRDKLGNLLMNELLVKLVHQHHDNRELLKDLKLEEEKSFRNTK